MIKAERKLNKLLSALGIILLIIALFSCAVSGGAAEKHGSITLRCVFSVEGGEHVLSGDEYSLAKIADAFLTDLSVSYMTLTQFENYDCDWKNLAASKMNEKAKALAYFCEKNHLYTESAVTGSNGELKFEDLSAGLYLAARTRIASENEDFNTDPLLVFIPENVNSEIIYEVVSTPKFSYSSPDKQVIPVTPSDSSLPQTGQLMWPVTLLAVLGCFLILGGSALLRKESSVEKKNS